MDYMKSKSAVTPGGEQLALARARLPGLRPEQRLQQAWSQGLLVRFNIKTPVSL